MVLVLKIEWNDLGDHVLELQMFGFWRVATEVLQECKDIPRPVHVLSNSEAIVVHLIIFLVKDNFVAKFFIESVHIDFVGKSIILPIEQRNWNLNFLNVELWWEQRPVLPWIAPEIVVKFGEIAT